VSHGLVQTEDGNLSDFLGKVVAIAVRDVYTITPALAVEKAHRCTPDLLRPDRHINIQRSGLIKAIEHFHCSLRNSTGSVVPILSNRSSIIARNSLSPTLAAFLFGM
jgi:hypothetical protein